MIKVCSLKTVPIAVVMCNTIPSIQQLEMNRGVLDRVVPLLTSRCASPLQLPVLLAQSLETEAYRHYSIFYLHAVAQLQGSGGGRPTALQANPS